MKNSAEQNLLKSGGEIAVDTSSIIYLQKLSLLDQYSHIKHIVVSEHIYNELTSKTNVNKNNDNSTYKNMIANRKLEVCRIDTSLHYTDSGIEKLSIPDASVIKLYFQEHMQGILSDDKEVCSVCNKKAIPYINTPMAVLSIAINRRISRELFHKKLEENYAIGRYSAYVIDYMKNKIEEYLDNV